jgi:hypothetical protein
MPSRTNCTLLAPQAPAVEDIMAPLASSIVQSSTPDDGADAKKPKPAPHIAISASATVAAQPLLRKSTSMGGHAMQQVCAAAMASAAVSDSHTGSDSHSSSCARIFFHTLTTTARLTN